MDVDQFKSYRLILASGSPRRQQFIKEMGLDFEVRLRPVEEIYPSNLKGKEISDYLAELKASVFKDDLAPNDILITADTVVWYQETSLAKAAGAQEAIKMLQYIIR